MADNKYAKALLNYTQMPMALLGAAFGTTPQKMSKALRQEGSNIYDSMKSAYTAPSRALQGQMNPQMMMDEDGNIYQDDSKMNQEGMNFALNFMGSGLGLSAINPSPKGSLGMASIKDVSKTLTDFEKAHKLAQQRAALPVSEGGLGLHPKNTYIERANAMGADDVYHGTAETEPITAIDPLKLGSATKSVSAKKAFWGVDDPTTAEGYANHAAMDAKVQDLIDKSQAAERSAHGGIFPRSEAEKQKYFQLSQDLMQQAQDLEAMFANNQNQGQNIMPLKIMNRNQATMDAGGNTFMDMQDEMHGILNNAIENKYPSVKINNLSDEIDWGRYNPATHYGVVDPTVVRSRFAAFDPFRRNENDIMAGVGVGALPFVDYNKKK